ncbi:MAG TPA: GGDEF domain-containing protein [Solirubrobacteraceae bacterium]|nr:GGDEF domain-containing protein [Solirubrobacteraceae bacterium]
MPTSPLGRTSQSYPDGSAAAGAGPAAGELNLITRRVTVRTGAETGLLVVFSEADRLLHVLGASGTSGNGLAASSRSDIGFVGRVLETARSAGEPIDPEHDSSLGVAASGAPLAYAAGAGIRPPGGPAGALCVGFSSRPADETLILWRIESYARLASLCLHERGTLDGLLASARLDGLTGCLNFAAIRAELDREIRRAERHARRLSCCFIDLDHFKRINDRHGHLHGNRVLAEVGAALRTGMRAGDTVGRYGGDEFLAILPDADEAAALVLAERLRATIFTGGAITSDERLDTSIGVAQWRPGSTADDLLATADSALLCAKDGGGGIVARAGTAAAERGRDGARGAARR